MGGGRILDNNLLADSARHAHPKALHSGLGRGGDLTAYQPEFDRIAAHTEGDWNRGGSAFAARAAAVLPFKIG
jgi:hypothetical protein